MPDLSSGPAAVGALNSAADGSAVKIGLMSRDTASYRQLLSSGLPAGAELVADSELSQAQVLLAEPARLAAYFRAVSQGLAEPLDNLRWVQSTYAGVDALMAAGLPRDYRLTNVRGVFGGPMSEYVLGYLLAGLRQHDSYRRQQRQALWQPLPGQTLQGKTMLLLGCGDIGRHIARSGALFGMRTLGVSRSGSALPEFEQVWPVSQLSQALPEADVVISVLPTTPQTVGLLGREMLAHCKPGAVLFNVGRGAVLDEPALLEALESGCLSAAVLDVFTEEPLPADNPLWRHPQITVTPHISAISFPEQVSELFLANLSRYLSQQPLSYPIDFDRGY